MYKMCDRCRFSVPTRQALCHVCGSHEFAVDEAPSVKPLEVGLKNCKETLGGAVGKMQSVFTALSREIEETAHKAQRATDSMRKMIFEAGPDHDQVLSFHRSIRAGRSAQSEPSAHRESLNLEPRISNFVSDDNLFSPTVSFVDYMAAHSTVSEPVAPVETNSFADNLPDFFTKLSRVSETASSLVRLQASEKAESSPEDVDALRRNIDELKGWFENYGREGLLVKELSIAQAVVELPSESGAESTPREHLDNQAIDESELQHSQAA